MKAYYDHRCLCCGCREPKIKLTLDHIVFVSKGGDSSTENIQRLWLSCKSAQLDRTIDYRP